MMQVVYALNIPYGSYRRQYVQQVAVANLKRREFQLEQAKLDSESNVYFQVYVSKRRAWVLYEAAKECNWIQELVCDMQCNALM
jgi:hypothetical protein